MNDYHRIEKIIHYATDNYRNHPNLEELASLSGLSTSHFHRLFHRWAGVPPKQFFKFLTATEAKARLKNSASVLETSLEVGLSGPGRLHDLLVTLDAATPGEVKNGGADLDIAWGFSESPFGRCSVAWTQRGICHLAFCDTDASDAIPTQLLSDWPRASFQQNNPQAKSVCERIFTDPGTHNPPLRLWVKATAFQLKVWQALLRIPEGQICSYRQIARAINQPQAARAVGTACGANSIGYLIPCHRVIRETGIVEGYRWGSLRKKAILAKEAALKKE